jgi:hypothetical protein
MTKTDEHTVNADGEFLRLNDIASSLTKYAKKCAVNFLASGRLEGQNRQKHIKIQQSLWL